MRERVVVDSVCRVLGEVRRERITQVELARRLDVPQTYVSRWENGRRPDDQTLLRIEDVLDLPHGTILRAAGLVDDLTDVDGVVRSDLRLTPDYQKMVLAFYETAIRHSAEARGRTHQSLGDPGAEDDIADAVSRTDATRQAPARRGR